MIDATTRPRHRQIPHGLAAPVFVVLVVFALIPCANLLIESLNPAGEAAAWPDLGNFFTLFNSKIGQQALVRTVRVSIIVTSICIVAGYPVALFIARTGSRWKPVLLAIVIFPFLISAVVRAFGWTVILGRSGLVNKGLIWLGLTD